MNNSIINAVGIALNTEFGDEYTIYSEAIEQGLEEPCFFIYCINPTNRQYFGKRYLRENPFCIQYIPADGLNAKQECIAVAERLYSCLEVIDEGGDLIRGTQMHYEIADGVLNFFVNYDMFVYRKTDAEDTIDEMKNNIFAKE